MMMMIMRRGWLAKGKRMKRSVVLRCNIILWSILLIQQLDETAAFISNDRFSSNQGWFDESQCSSLKYRFYPTPPRPLSSSSSSCLRCSMKSVWDAMQAFWEDQFGDGALLNKTESSQWLSIGASNKIDRLDRRRPKVQGDQTNNDMDSDMNVVDDDDLPAGTVCIFSIPAQSVKQGGLRLFLMLYLMGMQNTPSPQSWKADQPTSTLSTSRRGDNDDDNDNDNDKEYVIDYYYLNDGSALLTIQILSNAVQVYRTGSTPSTSYLLQETVIVQGILDELQQCATDVTVPEQHRLLVLPEGQANAIDLARESLSFA